MNDDLEAQFRQIYEEMDYFENPPLAFPKLGGAYEISYSKNHNLMFFLFYKGAVKSLIIFSNPNLIKNIVHFL